MTEPGFIVFLVDDDAAVLKGLSRLLRANGYLVHAFASAKAFLDAHDPDLPGCAIFDLGMPGMDGLQLQQALLDAGTERSIVFLTGVGDIPTTVRAMQAGASDFLTKPVDEARLLEVLTRVQQTEAARQGHRVERSAIRQRLSSLTPREMQVLTHVIAGRLNKQIAGDLGTVEKTIKVHRGRMMEKMGARSVAELVRMAGNAGVRPHQSDVDA